jgi:ankyrin repeat protein
MRMTPPGYNLELFVAAGSGDIGAMKKAITNGAEINSREDGKTPLHWAAYHAQVKAAEFLVTSGADVNARDHDQSTPLHYVASRDWISQSTRSERCNEIAKLLIANGADFGAQDCNKRTPVDLAGMGTNQELKDFLNTLGSSGGEEHARRVIERRGQESDPHIN